MPYRQIRCTAAFPADRVAPGAQAGVAFTVENLSDHQIEIPEGSGNGATGYLVERSAYRTLLQDTTSRHSGIIGGYPMPRPVAPGATFDLPAYYAPLLWPGTIEITPMCPIGRNSKGIMLPEVQITVATSGSAPNSAEAVTSAVDAVSPDFDDCAPQDTADAVVGSVHGYAARCQALVIPKDGFDIVVLAAYAPVTAAPTEIRPAISSTTPALIARRMEVLEHRRASRGRNAEHGRAARRSVALLMLRTATQRSASFGEECRLWPNAQVSQPDETVGFDEKRLHGRA